MEMRVACIPVYLYTCLPYYFDLRIPHIPIRPIGFHPFCHTLQGLSQCHSIGVDHCARDNRLLPFVLQIHLRNRDVEFAMQTRDERLNPSALFFEGSAGGEMEVDGEGGEHYDLRFWIDDLRLNFVLWNVNPPSAKMVFDIHDNIYDSFRALFAVEVVL